MHGKLTGYLSPQSCHYLFLEIGGGVSKKGGLMCMVGVEIKVKKRKKGKAHTAIHDNFSEWTIKQAIKMYFSSIYLH